MDGENDREEMDREKMRKSELISTSIMSLKSSHSKMENSVTYTLAEFVSYEQIIEGGAE